MLKFAVAVVLLGIALAQNIHFAAEEENSDHKAQKHSRTPLVSEKCAEGEYLYPGDNDRDWVCDCKPTYLYYPPKAACYRVYSKGPCKDKQILTPGPKAVPVCRKSVCEEPKVIFNGTCASLKDSSVCPKGSTLRINAKSLAVECSHVSASRVDAIDDESLDQDEISIVEGDFCYGGGKRAQNSTC